MFNFGLMRQTPMVNVPNQEGFIDIENNSGNVDIDLSQAQSINNNSNYMMESSPIIEPMRERVINRTIEHVVPHVCPVRTRIINHHIYKHTYTPNYTCCEENVCQHVKCGSCNSCCNR